MKEPSKISNDPKQSFRKLFASNRLVSTTTFMSMMSIAVVIAMFAFTSCTDSAAEVNGKNDIAKAVKTSSATTASTNSDEPDKVCEMPSELLEISGLTDVDENTVACVHDESGTIYFFDLQNCSIKKQVKFAGPGDFEGLTRVGNNYYVLRSDGTLFEVIMGKDDKPAVKEIESNVPAGDNEGLAYDQKTNQLLIAPKAKYEDKSFGKAYRAVYAYDLKSGKMLDKPVMQLNVEDAEAYLAKHEITQTQKKKSKKSNFPFDISSLTVHPEKDLFYLLTNKGHVVLMANREGKIVDAFPLDEKVFPQPEGITFIGSNKLVISSEGAKGTATIGVFNQ